ncbi:MAG: hypothetical protein Q4D29_01780 [Lachnospiraceae bacterium]|nr:hypothetical protein [Lachnospiraceae bacterium]
MKKITLRVITVITAVLLATVFVYARPVSAKILDEILDYQITADVNEDATVNIRYDITWKVLDSKSEGPLEWVQIGIPNKHCNNIEALSGNITSINTKNSGGTYAVIYFDRKYYADEVVQFSFMINQDYMYQVFPEEEVVEYKFTPGWFDSAPVDNIEIWWNSDKAIKIEPASLNEGDYYHWQARLSPNEKFSVEIQYPVDAYGFDLTQHNNSDDSDGYNFSEHSAIENAMFAIIMVVCLIFILIMCCLPVVIPLIVVLALYNAARGFKVTKEKKITRTIIEYYDSCPNCGGTRGEGTDKCIYCGTNMVKSKQEIKEEEVTPENKKILEYTSDGEYRYSDNPNRYVRVNVISVPHFVHTTPPPRSSSSSSFRSSGSHHSSCAHSSCACACACACAGGGRAGCSTKDFYKTNLKLSYFKKK